MSAAVVWARIVSYRNSAAKELLADYGSAQAIIQQLGNYPLKNAYHGHASGSSGDGMNSGANQNLDAAILYLKTHKPHGQIQMQTARGPNLALKNANVSHTEILNDLIESTNHLGNLAEYLNDFDPNWRTNNNAWSNYSAKFSKKKGYSPERFPNNNR